MRKRIAATFCLIFLFSILILPGCMSVSGSQNVIQASSTTIFNNKKIAVLPVKMQASLAPDSVMALRVEVNKRLAPALRGKIASAIVTDVPDVADRLNQTNSLANFEKLISSYESTGIMDKTQITALGQALGCDFLLLSRLKSEKMDIGFISKGAGASLDVMLINASSGEIVWAGSGEWKKGGIFSQGGAGFDEIAENIVTLAFESLQAGGGTQQSTAVAPEKIETKVSTQEPKQQNAAIAPEKDESRVPTQDLTTMNQSDLKQLTIRVQQKLAALNYDPGPADGIAGKKTKNAIKKFQQDNRLPVTGEPDQKTTDKLFNPSN